MWWFVFLAALAHNILVCFRLELCGGGGGGGDGGHFSRVLAHNTECMSCNLYCGSVGMWCWVFIIYVVV